MRRFAWIITLPITLLVVVFAVANQQSATIDLWPFELRYSLPLYALVAVSLLVGFLIGAAVMWVSAGRLRNKARESYYKANSLEREVAYLKRKQTEAKAPPQGATLPAHQPVPANQPRPAAQVEDVRAEHVRTGS